MERKEITNVVKFILIIWNVGLFSFIYENYYVNFAFRTHRIQGGLISILIYLIIYIAFCNLYKAFRFVSANIAETIFSQVISFGLADAILYAECCLIHNDYVNIFPGAVTVIFQLIGTAFLVMLGKQSLMKRVPPKQTLMLYGKGTTYEDAIRFKNRLMRKYEHMFNIQAILDENGNQEEIDKYFDECEGIILFELSNEFRPEYIRRCLNNDKIFYFTPEIEDIMCQGCEPKHLLDTPLMKYEYKYMNLRNRVGKRIMDFVFSFLMIIVTSPFMLLTAIAIKLQDGGPVLFKQQRYTQNMREFTIYKFRSMIVDAEKNGAQPCTEGDERITKVGKFIRATRLDELPQLFNILKGDMSFVGPRPERIEHVEKYTAELPEFKYRLAVKGGLTGYAQIYGKYNTSAYDKLRLDLMYIENQNLFLDLKLCMLTFKTMFEKESTEGFGADK